MKRILRIVSFDEAWATRVEADFVAKPLYVIGRDMLLRNKRAAGRDKDLLDVTLLEAHASPRPPVAVKKKAVKKKAVKKKAVKKKAVKKKAVKKKAVKKSAAKRKAARR
jgi:hypothetical protein